MVLRMIVENVSVMKLWSRKFIWFFKGWIWGCGWECIVFDCVL